MHTPHKRSWRILNQNKIYQNKIEKYTINLQWFFFVDTMGCLDEFKVPITPWLEKVLISKEDE